MGEGGERERIGDQKGGGGENRGAGGVGGQGEKEMGEWERKGNWFFTPSQPCRLYQGELERESGKEDGERRRPKHA